MTYSPSPFSSISPPPGQHAFESAAGAKPHGLRSVGPHEYIPESVPTCLGMSVHTGALGGVDFI